VLKSIVESGQTENIRERGRELELQVPRIRLEVPASSFSRSFHPGSEISSAGRRERESGKKCKSSLLCLVRCHNHNSIPSFILSRPPETYARATHNRPHHRAVIALWLKCRKAVAAATAQHPHPTRPRPRLDGFFLFFPPF
jgi:hypothetical protein